jgi:NAD(P)-dependent dehydrogenase (short-subunit alcohol dehydrogenase family)
MQRETLERLYSVAGKTVLVTGSSSGIGLMLAEGFLAAGARVYINSRNAQSLESVCARLNGRGEIFAITGDLSKPEGVETIVKTISEREPRLHVLINNAGITWGAPFESFPAKAWSSVMSVNVQSPFALIQGLLPALSAAATVEDPARVINIGSIYATTTHVMNAYSYAASKAALQQLTRVLARELAPKSILVNAIAPGLFPTKMTAFALREADSRAEILAGIPLGRPGTAEDIAGLAIMLSSRAGAYITGSIIPLDGGVLVHH